MFTTNRKITASLLGATAALGLVAGTALPAAANVVDTDRVLLTDANHDFGLHWTISAPRDGGYVDWDTEDGETTPIVSGYLYVDDRDCGRVRVEYFDDDHDLLGSRNSTTRCAPGNGKTQWWTEIDSFSPPQRRARPRPASEPDQQWLVRDARDGDPGPRRLTAPTSQPMTRASAATDPVLGTAARPDESSHAADAR